MYLLLYYIYSFPLPSVFFAECSLNCMHLKVIKYMGEKLVNSEKLKYICINMDSYATAANLAASAIQVLCICSVLKIVYILKVCMRTHVHANTHIPPHIYIYIYTHRWATKIGAVSFHCQLPSV
jgi:hypothetical protein